MRKQEKTSLFKRQLSIGGVTLSQRALFAEHLSVMLKAGLSITEALNIAIDSANGKLKKILTGILSSVESGHSLAESLSNYPKVFSGLFVNAVRAGESSGTLEDNLSHVAKQLQKDKELMSKVKGAMLYPVVVLTATFVLGMVLSFVVLPQITPLFTGLKIELPFTTRVLIAFATFVEAHGIALFSGIVAFIALAAWFVKQKFSHPLTHWFFIHTPIIKEIVRSANLARFSRTLGTLLKSGLHIDEAVEITKNTLGNFYYRRALANVSNRIGKGSSLADNLNVYPKLFPVMTSRMVSVGEESGKLDDTLLYISHFYEIEVDNSTKTLSTAIEPLLLLFIGLAVGFLALSIITPIYNITGSV